MADVKSWGPGNRVTVPKLGSNWRDQIQKVETGWKDEPEPALVASGYWGPTYDVAGLGAMPDAAIGRPIAASLVVGGFTALATWYTVPRFARRFGDVDVNVTAAIAGLAAAAGIVGLAFVPYSPFRR